MIVFTAIALHRWFWKPSEISEAIERAIGQPVASPPPSGAIRRRAWVSLCLMGSCLRSRRGAYCGAPQGGRQVRLPGGSCRSQQPLTSTQARPPVQSALVSHASSASQKPKESTQTGSPSVLVLQ
jgi:hypothetical protein